MGKLSTQLSWTVGRKGELTKTADKMRCKEGKLCVTSKVKVLGTKQHRKQQSMEVREDQVQRRKQQSTMSNASDI